MATNKTNGIIPFEATHPGILIRDELEVRDNLNQKELAILLGVKPSFLNEIIKGKRPITASMALLLEKALEIPADYWMRFQSQYELDCAKVKEKNIERGALICYWNVITRYVPTKLFAKKGYLTDDLRQNIDKVQSAFGVDSAAELENKFSNINYCFFARQTDSPKDNKKEKASFLVRSTHQVSRRASCGCKNKVSASRK